MHFCMHQRNMQMAKGKINSRDKGARFERLLAKMLREHGYEAERGCQHSGGKDSPDVKHNMTRLHIEAKDVEKLNIWNALEQSRRDAGDDEIPVVMFKRNRTKVYVAVPFEEFMEMFKAWEVQINDSGLETISRSEAAEKR